MKITKVLTDKETCYYSSDYEYSLCHLFVHKFLGHLPSKLNVTFSTKNPKKKGFKRIIRRYNSYSVTFNGRNISTTINQTSFLNDMNIGEGESFWLKLEEIQ